MTRIATQISERQLEILELVAEGMTNQEIGDKLFLSVGSVAMTLRILYRQIGANDRAHAVYLALKAGVMT